MITEEDLLETLIGEIAAALGDDLLGIYLHGSFATGEFAQGRANINLLVVLPQDPDDDLRQTLQQAQDEVGQIFPEWDGHLEAEYVGQPGMARFAPGGSGDDEQHFNLRCDEGRPLYCSPITELAQLTWFSVRQSGVTLFGPPATELIPPVSEDAFLTAVRGHAARWPDWVRSHTSVHDQVTGVLVMCRAWYSARRHQQAAKREAALFTAAEFSQWAPLIRWAETWWFQDGSDAEPGQLDEVIAFVDDLSARVLAVAPRTASDAPGQDLPAPRPDSGRQASDTEPNPA